MPLRHLSPERNQKKQKKMSISPVVGVENGKYLVENVYDHAPVERLKSSVEARRGKSFYHTGKDEMHFLVGLSSFCCF